jgi:hypothetical protein
MNTAGPSYSAGLVSVAIPERDSAYNSKVNRYNITSSKDICTYKEICYHDVINYSRSCVKGQRSCVMCGRLDSKECNIPGQNKDVCKVCDSLIWFSESQRLSFKFCKGCKNFVSLYDFVDKPKASKCGKCRNRCRSSYSAKRTGTGSADSCDPSGPIGPDGASPRGVADAIVSSEGGDGDIERSRQYMQHHFPKAAVTPTHGTFARPRQHQHDPALAYSSVRGSNMTAYTPPAYGIASSPYLGSLDKENLGRRSASRPRIGGVLGDRSTSVDNAAAGGGAKTPRGAGDKEDVTPSGPRLPRIPTNLLNIHSASQRLAAAAEETASAPAPASTPASTPAAAAAAAGKGVLDEMLLLNTFLRKSPLTFISTMPTPEVQSEYAGFGCEDFSPSQHRSRMYNEQRAWAQTPGTGARVPSTPQLDGGGVAAATPSSSRSWDSQEGGAWYHDVLIAMSKDQSVKKTAAVSFDETADMPVAKRIRYGDAPSPAPSPSPSPAPAPFGLVRSESTPSPPPTPWLAVASRGSFSCPLVSNCAENKYINKIERSASCSKVGDSKSGQEKWEWDPNANPLMHLAMVLSKNESSEEEIFRDLSSDSSCGDGDGGSDSESVHSFRATSSSTSTSTSKPGSPAERGQVRGVTPVPMAAI